MLKHLIITPARMSHFFGQGAVESECLGKMVEASSSGERYRASLQSEVGGWYNNPDDDYYVKMGYSNNNGNLGKEDAIKFRDRGMKQLTGRSNYADYWNYRGWLREQKSYGEKGDYDWHWWDNSKKKAAEIDNPQIVGMEDYLTIDAGCWYWTAGRPTPINSKITESERVKDIEADVRGVSIAINGVNSNTGDPNGLEERKDNTKRIFNILMNGE
ncbi:MAG: hypothetical protein FWD67_02405 [Betaproteobacteria bacterium]|nr:hypothetical protein [Betaproteobacteria bacterium]